MTYECRPSITATTSACWSVVKCAVSLAALAACITAAGADDKSDYERRAAANDRALFQALDRNSDGRLTLSEARGDLNLGPRFDDMDTNRDGVVTMEELDRYIGKQYGIQGDRVSQSQ